MHSIISNFLAQKTPFRNFHQFNKKFKSSCKYYFAQLCKTISFYFLTQHYLYLPYQGTYGSSKPNSFKPRFFHESLNSGIVENNHFWCFYCEKNYFALSLLIKPIPWFHTCLFYFRNLLERFRRWNESFPENSGPAAKHSSTGCRWIHEQYLREAPIFSTSS